jgi:hypothetical protein
MTDRLLEKIAAVLEATADDYDAREAEYARKLSSAREELVSPLLDKVALATGLDEGDIRDKLAAADLSVVEILAKMASDESASELGGPGSTKTAGVENMEDGASAADERFLKWLSK